jgi:hypothetical protein
MNLASETFTFNDCYSHVFKYTLVIESYGRLCVSHFEAVVYRVSELFPVLAQASRGFHL